MGSPMLYSPVRWSWCVHLVALYTPRARSTIDTIMRIDRRPFSTVGLIPSMPCERYLAGCPMWARSAVARTHSIHCSVRARSAERSPPERSSIRVVHEPAFGSADHPRLQVLERLDDGRPMAWPVRPKHEAKVDLWPPTGCASTAQWRAAAAGGSSTRIRRSAVQGSRRVQSQLHPRLGRMAETRREDDRLALPIDVAP